MIWQHDVSQQSQKFRTIIVRTHSAKITEVSFMLAKAESPILVTVLIHTYTRRNNESDWWEVMRGSNWSQGPLLTNMMLFYQDTYDGMVTAVSPLPANAAAWIESCTPLELTIINRQTARIAVIATHGEKVREVKLVHSRKALIAILDTVLIIPKTRAW